MKKNQSVMLFSIITAVGYWFLMNFTGIQSPVSIVLPIFSIQFIQYLSELTGENFINYLIQLLGHTAFAYIIAFVLQNAGLSGTLSVLSVFVAYYATPAILNWLGNYQSAKA